MHMNNETVKIEKKKKKKKKKKMLNYKIIRSFNIFRWYCRRKMLQLDKLL